MRLHHLPALIVALIAAAMFTPEIVFAGISQTLSRRGIVVLDTDQNDTEVIVVDRTRGYLYVATYTSPGRIVKLRLATPTDPPVNLGELVLEAAEGQPQAMVLDEERGILYYFGSNPDSVVVKVAVGEGDAPPTRVGALTMPPATAAAYESAFDPINNIVYAAHSTFPGKISKVAGNGPTEPPTLVGILELNAGEENLGGIAIDPARGIGWIGAGTLPAKIVQFTLGAPGADPTRDTAITLPGGLNQVWGLRYHPLTQQLYGVHFEGGLVQIDASGSQPRFAGSVTAGSASDESYAFDFDPVLGIGIIGTCHANPNNVLLYSLGDGFRGSAILADLLLENDDGCVYRNLAIDPDNLVAYLATDTSLPDNRVVVLVQMTAGPGVDLRTVISKFSGATKNGKTRVKAQATVSNISSTGAGTFFVRSYLSRDRVLSADDILIGKERLIKSLAPGKIRKTPASGSLTGVVPGTYYIITVADPQDLTKDGNPINNVAVSGPLQL